MYTYNILDHLIVVNGRAQYIESDIDEEPTPTEKSPKNSIKHRQVEPQDIKKSKKKAKPDEGTYEEHYETYEEYCIHRQQLVNQGITMCDINQDVTMCGSCPYRKSRTMKVKVSSASTASTKKSKK